MERLLAQEVRRITGSFLLTRQTNTAVHLWSTGNLRINTLDLTLGSQDAVEVLTSIRSDSRVSGNSGWRGSQRVPWRPVVRAER
jgi:hypothetical protein